METFSFADLFKIEAVLESDGAASTWKAIAPRIVCHFTREISQM
jgi:hypothetical protein